MARTHSLSRYQREYLKQLVIESEVQRFSREERLAYVRSRLKVDISIDYIDYVARNIKKYSLQRLAQFRNSKDAYVCLFFQSVEEIKHYQRVLWQVFHNNKENGFLQKSCISELHQLTITLANLYELLPTFMGIPLAYEDTSKRMNESTGTYNTTF